MKNLLSMAVSATVFSTAILAQSSDQGGDRQGTPQLASYSAKAGRFQPIAVSSFQDDAGEGVSASMSFTVLSQYAFRGFLLENEGGILQQTLDLGFDLLGEDSVGSLDSLDLNFGMFNSLHAGPTGESGAGTADPKAWFENDTYLGLEASSGKVGFGLQWTNLNSPNGSFKSVNELGLTVSYDDSAMWEDSAISGLNPEIAIVQEVNGQTDGGFKKGTYVQLGVNPSMVVGDAENITVSLPVTLGLGVDYFEQPTGGGDDFFGFFDLGIGASMPLESIPTRFGTWTMSANVNALFMGSNLEAVNGGDNFEIIAGISLNMDF